MRAREFLYEQNDSNLANKIEFIKSKFDSGAVTDPKTIDYIYKILQKPEIKKAIDSYLVSIQNNDPDVDAIQKRNENILSKVIRKLPVPKENLDKFVAAWANSSNFINTDLLTSGNKGTLKDLIPDPTAFIAFETFEKLRSQVKSPKRGTLGYGEFGLSLLSSAVSLSNSGDIEVNGQPIEVKGNDGRLYADERAGIKNENIKVDTKNQNELAKSMAKKNSEPGLLTNVFNGIINNDPQIIEQAKKAFTDRGVNNADDIINTIQNQGPQGLETLKIEWWKAGFNDYHSKINMPILIIGFNQFLISDNADDFIAWNALPKKISNYGYMFGRAVGQARETYPKIFIPGHNI